MGRISKVFQIVGYKNSGKTTLMKILIKELSSLHYRVGTIKHHGHGTKPPEIMEFNKDHVEHFQNGAFVSMVEGNQVGQLLLQSDQITLETIIEFYSVFSLDIILVEGYKKEAYPKIVLIRSEDDLHLLKSITNILCVITHVDCRKKINGPYPCFLIKDKEKFIEWFFRTLEEKA